MVQDLPYVLDAMAKVGGWTLPISRRQQAPYISKTQLVDVLEQIAILLELSGANGFRVLSLIHI